MTKAELVEQGADAVGPSVTKRECGLMVDAFLDALKDALARGDGIELRGFGTFKVRHRKARTGRNPRTGETVEVPARDVPVFKPSRHLRSRVERGYGVSVTGEPLSAILQAIDWPTSRRSRRDVCSWGSQGAQPPASPSGEHTECGHGGYAGSPPKQASDNPVGGVSAYGHRLPPMRWRSTPARAPANPFTGPPEARPAAG